MARPTFQPNACCTSYSSFALTDARSRGGLCRGSGAGHEGQSRRRRFADGNPPASAVAYLCVCEVATHQNPCSSGR